MPSHRLLLAAAISSRKRGQRRVPDLFRGSLAPLTDSRVVVSDLRDVAQPLADAEGIRARFSVAAQWLRSRAAVSAVDRRTAAAVDIILASGGRSSIDDVAATVGATRQHLARLFAHHVGISPKVFARVTRFRRALRLASSGSERWADLAMEVGYFDQSHLIAEFRVFAGETPVPFFLSR